MRESPLDKSETTIKAMFDTLAPRYDILNRLLSLGRDTAWRRKLVRTVLELERKPERDSNFKSDSCPDTGAMLPEGGILDVCCGTGDLTLAWYQATKRFPIIGIDFSRTMLDVAQKKLQATGATDNVQLLEGDATSLPFSAEKFAIVSTSFGLRNIPDPNTVLREMIRVCRSDGVVSVLEFARPTHPVFAPFLRLYSALVLPLCGRLFTDRKHRKSSVPLPPYEYLNESIVRFDTISEMVDRLESHGLKDVRVQPMMFGAVAHYWGRKFSTVR